MCEAQTGSHDQPAGGRVCVFPLSHSPSLFIAFVLSHLCSYLFPFTYLQPRSSFSLPLCSLFRIALLICCSPRCVCVCVWRCGGGLCTPQRDENSRTTTENDLRQRQELVNRTGFIEALYLWVALPAFISILSCLLQYVKRTVRYEMTTYFSLVLHFIFSLGPATEGRALSLDYRASQACCFRDNAQVNVGPHSLWMPIISSRTTQNNHGQGYQLWTVIGSSLLFFSVTLFVHVSPFSNKCLRWGRIRWWWWCCCCCFKSTSFSPVTLSLHIHLSKVLGVHVISGVNTLALYKSQRLRW